MSSNSQLRRSLFAMRQLDPDGLRAIFTRHGVAEAAGLDVLLARIGRDGANSFVTYTFRFGDGIEYEEILTDVAWMIGATHPTDASIEARERAVVDKVLSKMTEKDRARYEELREQFRNARGNAELLKNILKGAAAAGLHFGREQLVKLLIKQGMKGIAARAPGFLIPGVNILLGVWTANDVAGPAYRKTVPTIIDVAFFRYGQGEV